MDTIAVITEDPTWYLDPDPSGSYRYTAWILSGGRLVESRGFDSPTDAECYARYFAGGEGA